MFQFPLLYIAGKQLNLILYIICWLLLQEFLDAQADAASSAVLSLIPTNQKALL